MSERAIRPGPRTFKHFPEDSVCQVCGTNDDGECVLVPIDGTQDGNIAEAQPFHLACAIVEGYNINVGIAYRRRLEN